MAADRERSIGGYLFIEDLSSITGLQDQRVLSNIGEFRRIGYWSMVVW